MERQDPVPRVAEFVESIPFTKTRSQVQARIRNTNVYPQRYGVPP